MSSNNASRYFLCVHNSWQSETKRESIITKRFQASSKKNKVSVFLLLDVCHNSNSTLTTLLSVGFFLVLTILYMYVSTIAKTYLLHLISTNSHKSLKLVVPTKPEQVNRGLRQVVYLYRTPLTSEILITLISLCAYLLFVQGVLLYFG